MKKLGLLFGFMVLIAGLIACGTSNTDSGTLASTQSSTPTQAAAPKVFKVGDSVKIAGYAVKVVSVGTSKGDNYITPQKGQFVNIIVSITNNTGKPETVSSAIMWELHGSDSTVYTETTNGSSDSAPDGTVTDGSAIKGTLSYDTPVEKKFTLLFKPDFLTNDIVTFNLSV